MQKICLILLVVGMCETTAFSQGDQFQQINPLDARTQLIQAAQQDKELAQIERPELDDGEVVLPGQIPKLGLNIDLPSTVTAIAIAGAGRYVLCHLQDLSQVAVVDLQERRIAKFLTVPSGHVAIAGSRFKLFAVGREDRVLMQYSLENFDRELVAVVPGAGGVSSVETGHMGCGPLLIVNGSAKNSSTHLGLLLDPNTLSPINANNLLPLGSCARFSPDGKLLASNIGGVQTWRMPIDPEQTHRYDIRSNAHFLSPNINGSIIYTNSGAYTAHGRILEGATMLSSLGWTVASANGNLYFQYARENETSYSTVFTGHVLLQGDNKLVASFTNLPAIFERDYHQNSEIPYNDRVILSPDFGVLAILPKSDSRLHLRSFDLIQSLEEKGVDYLLVRSLPPASANAGEEFLYEIDVLSKRGNVKISLNVGPEGMALVEQRLRWQIPVDMATSLVPVVLTVTDNSKQEVFHSFNLSVKGMDSKESLVSVAPKQGIMNERTETDASTALEVAKVRVWRDVDGLFEMRAVFRSVEDRRLVVLFTETGRIIKVPLTRLSAEDIYVAVEADLKQRQLLSGSVSE